MTQHFPWPQYRRPWTLSVAVVSVTPEGDADVDADRGRIRLDGIDGWRSVGLEFRLSTSEPRPSGVERPFAYVMVTGARSNFRLPVRMRETDAGFIGSCRLSRDSLAGTVDIQAHVVTDPSDSERARVVGDSNSWSLVVESGEAPPLPGTPPFEIVRLHFSADDAPSTLRTAAASYALMDVSGPAPVLYLNQDVKGLEHVIDAKSPKLEKRRLRDLIGAQIAHHALATLFRHALADCALDAEDIALPDDRLLRQVIEKVADAVPSVEDGEALVRALLEGGTRSGQVWMEVDNAVTALTGLGSAVARSVEEVHLA